MYKLISLVVVEEDSSALIPFIKGPYLEHFLKNPDYLKMFSLMSLNALGEGVTQANGFALMTSFSQEVPNNIAAMMTINNAVQGIVAAVSNLVFSAALDDSYNASLQNNMNDKMVRENRKNVLKNTACEAVKAGSILMTAGMIANEYLPDESLFPMGMYLFYQVMDQFVQSAQIPIINEKILLNSTEDMQYIFGQKDRTKINNIHIFQTYSLNFIGNMALYLINSGEIDEKFWVLLAVGATMMIASKGLIGFVGSGRAVAGTRQPAEDFSPRTTNMRLPLLN